MVSLQFYCPVLQCIATIEHSALYPNGASDILMSSSRMHRKYTTLTDFKQEKSERGGLFEVVDAVVYGPPPAAAPTGQCLLCLDQVGAATAWAAEEASTFGLAGLLFHPGPDEDAGGKLQ